MKNLSLKFKPSADPQKMLASLYRQGFDTSVCREAVEEYAAEVEEE